MKYAEVQNCIGGAFVSPDAPTLDVYNPSSGVIISRVPLSGARDVDAAVAAARAALPAWSATPIKERVQVLYRYKALLEQHFHLGHGFGALLRLDVRDGVRAYFDNGDVVHIRASGNAPQLRVYAIASTQARADAIVAQALGEPDGIVRQMLALVSK